MPVDEVPDVDVVTAFGGRGPVVLLPGGQGRTYRAGDIVIKPADDEDEVTWAAEVLSTVDEDGFRVARPVQSSGGRWVVDGWAAWQWVTGEHRLHGGPWDEAIAACERFHAAVADVGEPGFLARRHHHFAEADRMAWGDGEVDLPAPIGPVVARLRALVRPITARCQIVHGDFAGNLLFADALPPAVIDFSPYWRPAGYPTALTIVDAVLWYGEGVGLISRAEHLPGLDQLLLRGLLFRLTLDGLLMRRNVPGVRWEASQIEWDVGRAGPLIAHIEGGRHE
jgi:uncharacterized protein (TIGR02569 family)